MNKSIDHVKIKINQYGSSINLYCLDMVSIPEADVLLCTYNGIRINVKFDYAYGWEIESIGDDKLKDDVLKNKLRDFLEQ
ncbi:hypothetical protein ACFQNF_19450 [Iodobacter arcticus]|uniref:Uncharacterized protein n=1 Tax=Iodobacter arcticus TaxID=590593 RepID=A0ABW2R336_9NEIS